MKYGIKHLSKGYLMRGDDEPPTYQKKLDKGIMWLGTYEEAEERINELGARLHGLVCVPYV